VQRSMVVAVVVVLLVVVAVVAILWALDRNRALPTAQPVAMTADVPKPRVIAQTFQGCPASGDGGVPVLNTLKNRIDEGNWEPVTFDSILNLGWPPTIEHKPRSRWSKADTEAIAEHEGAPVQVEGYLLRAKKMSPETANCHSVGQVDFHIWMGNDPDDGRERSVVIETTPRVMFHHPQWTLRNFQQLASRGEKVRISGWLMMDPEHPDQIGKTRGTIWEIHPVMQVERLVAGQWVPLDDGTTGVSSAPAVAETAPPVTPVAMATMPPEGDSDVQDNSVVEIVTVNYDGTKGPSEPDEYVEIMNTGDREVDITDWVLQDEGARNFYKWEGYTLEPGATIRVYTNEVHNETGGFTFESRVAIWANGGDIAELYDADKVLVSRYAYGSPR
jgi:hypothetical protein